MTLTSPSRRRRWAVAIVSWACTSPPCATTFSLSGGGGGGGGGGARAIGRGSWSTAVPRARTAPVRAIDSRASADAAATADAAAAAADAAASAESATIDEPMTPLPPWQSSGRPPPLRHYDRGLEFEKAGDHDAAIHEHYDGDPRGCHLQPWAVKSYSHPLV